MRLSRSTGALLSCAFLACGPSETATPAAAPATASVAPSPPPAATATTAASASPTAASTASASPPPAGLYDATVTEKSSTCEKRDAGAGGPFENKGLFVAARHRKDAPYGVNLPLVAMGGFGVMRSDVPLEKGKSTTSKSHPDPGCKYEIKHEIEVLDTTSTTIKIAVRAEYGDAAGCTKLPKTGVVTSCKKEMEQTFTLVQAACSSWKCNAEGRTAPGGWTFTCKDCPDGGT